MDLLSTSNLLGRLHNVVFKNKTPFFELCEILLHANSIFKIGSSFAYDVRNI